MSKMPDHFAASEAQHRSFIMHDTFGHLFPTEPAYEGTVRLAVPYYGSTGSVVIIDESDTLPGGSPWWFDAVNKFADEVGEDMNPGEVAEFKIKVNIVKCEQELEDWEAKEYEEEGLTPDTWEEIHVSFVSTTMLVTSYD